MGFAVGRANRHLRAIAIGPRTQDPVVVCDVVMACRLDRWSL
jgi:hypothetical protein